MFSTIADSHPYLLYAAPPLIGALIGYLTNRVAIRMLFRPLRAWYLGPLKIPMTPGVIPSKRHELAENIGEMVGEHLVTGDEINRALQKDDFQEHLRILIETRTASVMKKDLGSLKTIIPEYYSVYFDIAFKTVTYRVKEILRRKIFSDSSEAWVNDVVDSGIDRLLGAQFSELFSTGARENIVELFNRSVDEILENDQVEQQLGILIETEIATIFQSGRSCADVLPKQLTEAIVEIIRNQTPYVLSQAAELIKDPDIKDRIISAVKRAIDEFIDTLGPMSTMARSFLEADIIDEKIRQYLDDKEADIDALFHDEEIVIRVRAALGERIGRILNTPLTDLTTPKNVDAVPMISKDLAAGIIGIFKRQEAKDVIGGLLETFLDSRLEEGSRSLGSILEQLLGKTSIDSARSRIKQEAIAAAKSPQSLRLIDRTVDDLFNQMVNKPIGRLDHLIPSGVIVGVNRSLRDMTTRILIAEIPSVVALIKIRKMVSDKIDSFDLLRLEKLLLSIMQEQFKYINLFGGLLGFIIGCANLLFLVGS